MIAKPKKHLTNLGENMGYVGSYFIFTTALYYVLSLLNRLPQNWNYFHVMGITFSVILLALIIKGVVK